MTLRPRLVALALPLLGLAACASSGSNSPVPRLVAAGRYEEAVVEAARRYEKDPSDARAEEEYRLSSVAALLERARRATFKGRDEEALELALEARRIEPGNRVVEDWIQKAHLRISDRALTRAHALLAKKELASAFASFQEALEHDPTSTAAEQGMKRTLVLINYREGLGDTYYKEGVRSLRAYWLQRARAQLAYVVSKYAPDHERAQERSEDVARLLAEERTAIAEELEAEGRYFAAGNEFRLALLLDPDNAEAEAGRERMELEMGAKQKLDHAQWLRLRGRYDEAQSALDEGRELTTEQSEEFETEAIDIELDQYDLLYQEALRLEHDFQYPEAVAKYDELLAIAGYYEDAITRRATLEEFIERAEDLYARAMETSEPAQRLSYLRELELFWPEYRDVPGRVEALTAELAEPGGGDGDDGE